MAQSWLECKWQQYRDPFFNLLVCFPQRVKILFWPFGPLVWKYGGGWTPRAPPLNPAQVYVRESRLPILHTLIFPALFFLLTQLLKSYPRPPFLEQWLQGIARQAVHVVFYYQPPLDRSKLHRLWLLSPRAPPRPSTVDSSHDPRL